MIYNYINIVIYEVYMSEGISHKEYGDYLKYYSNENLEKKSFNILSQIQNSEDKPININLNLFLKLLGATNEIIEDDYKTLQFMLHVKFSLDECRASSFEKRSAA